MTKPVDTSLVSISTYFGSFEDLLLAASASRRVLLAITYHNQGIEERHLGNDHEANWNCHDRENAACHSTKLTTPQGDPGSDRQTDDEGRKRKKKEHAR